MTFNFSAECIKNICLCINGKISLEQIKAEHKKEQQNPQKDREDGTLTFRPNPNRRNNGEFDFGPDRGSSSASGSGSSGENSGDEKSTSKKSSSGYKDDNFTLSSVGTNRTSDNNKVELEDCVKFGKHSKGGDSVWLGNGLSYKNDTFKEGDKVNIIYDLEFEESYTFNEDGSYIYNPPKKVSIAFEQIANSNGEVSLNRGGVLEIYSNRDKVFAVNVKISISIGKSKDIKNMKTKESNYNKEPDPDLNNVQDITYYPSSHKEKNKNEGRITNKDEITEGLKKFINVYKNKISIDLLSKELKSID